MNHSPTISVHQHSNIPAISITFEGQEALELMHKILRHGINTTAKLPEYAECLHELTYPLQPR